MLAVLQLAAKLRRRAFGGGYATVIVGGTRLTSGWI
jgi:hypothetical protein